MSSAPRFGQGSPVKVYVPISVKAGVSFPLKAVRFDSNVPVKVIATPTRRFFLGNQVKSFNEHSDESGNVDAEIPTNELKPGTYTVTITGTSNGEEVAAEALLKVEDPQTDTAP